MTAVVLKRADSSESDRRVWLLTKEQGIMDAIAKGARKAGSRLAGVTEPLTCATFHLASGRHRSFVTQVQLSTSFPGLRSDYERLSAAMALAELYSAVIHPGQAAAYLFEMLVISLKAIETHRKPIVALVWAQLKLLAAEGLMPSWMTCVATGEPLRLSPAAVSPAAGGFICDAECAAYSDFFRVSAEALIGLDRCGSLDEPPPNLKRLGECLRTLYAFWLDIAGKALPANRALVESFKQHLAPH